MIRTSLFCVVCAVLPCLAAAQSDSSRPERVSLQLPDDLPSADSYSTGNALGKLTFKLPVAVATPPGEKDRVFVVEKGGVIWVVNLSGEQPKKKVFLDLPAMLQAQSKGTVSTSLEQGLLGLAFHPDYAQNGYFYVYYSLSTDDDGKKKVFERISRFCASPTNPDEADTTSETPLISQVDRANNHQGGDLHFGADGYLYISIGDEGAGNDRFDNARFIDKDFFAAILRIDVDQKEGNLLPNPHKQDSTILPSAVHTGSYLIPKDNPFIGATYHNGKTLSPEKVRTEIWATGLRNPWRFSFDPPTGRMFIGEVGQDQWEEVDIGVAGGNYGWSYREGLHPGPRTSDQPADAKVIDPIYDYPHKGGGQFSGISISGGVVYRGKRIPKLTGDYLFADYVSRCLWSLHEQDGKWNVSYLGSVGAIVGFGVDPRDGEPLLVDHSSGVIKHINPPGLTGTPETTPPARLSQTNLFSKVRDLTPVAGVAPYSINLPSWNDYAIKSFWFCIPDGETRINVKKEEVWDYPPGAVWVQNFDLEMRRGDPSSRQHVETRILVRTGQDCYGISYKWREDQSDAELVPEKGADDQIEIQEGGALTTQNWHFPARNECRVCHNAQTNYALGFNGHQLNAFSKEASQNQTESQYALLNNAGFFRGRSSADVPKLPAFAPVDDNTVNLETRARSYLAANCAYCHRPGGTGLGQFDARIGTSLKASHLIDGNLTNNLGDATNRVIATGDASHSMLLRRLRGEGVPKMPPIGSSEIDPVGTRLMEEWIKQLAIPPEKPAETEESKKETEPDF